MVETNNNSNANHKHHVDVPFETATFGMGCFWGADALFGATIGVLRTKVGYSGGTTIDPDYKNLGDHVEVISIDFDPTKITYAELLNRFWNNHEYGLSARVKRQYTSVIYYHNDEQKHIAEVSLQNERVNRVGEEIITEIQKCGIIYAAEDYHQKYYLQTHKKLAEALGLNHELLQTSHIAARLNGYLVGVGGEKQYLDEAGALGLTDTQIDYVRRYVKENEGGALYC